MRFDEGTEVVRPPPPLLVGALNREENRMPKFKVKWEASQLINHHDYYFTRICLATLKTSDMRGLFAIFFDFHHSERVITCIAKQILLLQSKVVK